MSDEQSKLVDFVRSINTMPNVYQSIMDNFAQMADRIRESQLAALRMADYFANFNKVINSLVPDISKITDFVSNIQKFHEIEKKSSYRIGLVYLSFYWPTSISLHK